MTNKNLEFLVAATNTAPKSLPESIRQVGNLSAGFCRSWLSNEITDALTTSEEALQHLDHIQNELLRHRDEKAKLLNWPNSPFKSALETSVGELLAPATPSHKSLFLSLAPGAGAFPSGTSTASLTLAEALNKLKHRNTIAINFTVSSSGQHIFYIFTNAGMGKSDTISKFDVHVFCNACKFAAGTI
jgi:hypothetical protein